MAEKLKRRTQIRPVKVKALKDCELATHTLKRGMVTEMQSDWAERYVGEGLVEIVQEKAVREAEGKESR